MPITTIRWDDVTPIDPRDVRSIDDLSRLTPLDVEQALECIDVALRLFHEAHDNRAVFLRSYRVITRNLRDALATRAPFTNRIFFDGAWVAHLAARFATLYFRSLATFTRPPEVERAWKIAHESAIEKRLGVTQDVLLGINAHINYDLSYAIYQALIEHRDHERTEASWLHRRKFDHDQINNVLVRSIPEVQRTLGREYGGVLGVLAHSLFTLDDLLAALGLKYYRERVWWDAMSFLATRKADGTIPAIPGDAEVEVVQQKLDWESTKLAETIRDGIGPLAHIAALTRRRRLGRFEPT